MNVPGLETIERDYSPKGVRFYYVYKALAHPEYNNYVTPYTLEERLMHAREAERVLGSRIPWLCDAMSNEVKHSLGNVPNSEFVIDPQGRVARSRVWSNPKALRRDLEQLVGPVEKPTRVEDLDLPEIQPAPTVAKGIVPRPELPPGLRPLKIEPQLGDGEQPFYVKLRAEGDRGLLEGGKGTLYLGFHLDPLYRVHWNNQAPPLVADVRAPSPIKVTPARLEAPKVKEPADADPREFLLDLDAAGASGPLEVSVRYFACDDALTFCVPVDQRYRVHLERDGDGGSAIRRRPGGGRRGDVASRLKRMDADGDGRVTEDEARGPVKMFFDRMDMNGDGAIDAEEAEALRRRMGDG